MKKVNECNNSHVIYIKNIILLFKFNLTHLYKRTEVKEFILLYFIKDSIKGGRCILTKSTYVFSRGQKEIFMLLKGRNYRTFV